IEALKQQQSGETLAPDQKKKIGGEIEQKESELKLKRDLLSAEINLYNAVVDRPGYFFVRAPLAGTILNSDFAEKLRNRTVKPSEPLLRVGNKQGRWEIELKIPQKHIGQVLRAFAKEGVTELDVDLLLLTDPTRVYTGKLARDKIGGE